MPEIPSIMNRDHILQGLQRAMDGSSQRQKVIANNIANVDTPNFKRSDVPFQEVLRSSAQQQQSLAMKTTNPRHITVSGSAGSSLPIIQDNSSTYRRDGNNVDAERETVELAKNKLYYDASVQMMQIKLQILKQAMQEGAGST